jgi:hypothetical protein
MSDDATRLRIDLSKMCDWERKKAIFILSVAESLGMNTSRFGELAVNQSSGYTYLWLEDYSFTIYMPITCELKKEEVVALWSCSEDGEEIEFNLKENTTLKELEDWSAGLSKEHDEMHK